VFIYKHIFFWCSDPGGGSSRGRRQKHGEDVVHTLKVSLEDLYNGTSKKLSLSRNILCQKCKGYISSTLAYWILHSRCFNGVFSLWLYGSFYYTVAK
jgi:DnaJ family protein A protein 2